MKWKEESKSRKQRAQSAHYVHTQAQYFHTYCGWIWAAFKKDFFFKKGCPGWGANSGSFDLIYFLIPTPYR
jgi:hypothetical protein